MQEPQTIAPFECPKCSKSYKNKKSFEKHVNDCSSAPKASPKTSPKTSPEIAKAKKPTRRKGVDANLRKEVWDTYVGQKTSAKCFCCWKSKITPFTYCNTFQAGHIISYAHGGPDSIGNLLPICRDCNMNMSSEDWDNYIGRQPSLPLRVYGENPPGKVVWATTVIQSLARMYQERKNPDSHWKQEWIRRYNHLVSY